MESKYLTNLYIYILTNISNEIHINFFKLLPLIMMQLGEDDFKFLGEAGFSFVLGPDTELSVFFNLLGQILIVIEPNFAFHVNDNYFNYGSICWRSKYYLPS